MLKVMISLLLALAATSSLASSPIPGFLMTPPVPLSTILQTYGQFDDGSRNNHHAGLDFNVPADTPVLAVASGTVRTMLLADKQDKTHCLGNVVMISHNSGQVVSLYAHLKSISVPNGLFVSQGQVIGYVGNTAGKLQSGEDCQSFGAHLHFELKKRPVLATITDDSIETWGYTPDSTHLRIPVGQPFAAHHPDAFDFYNPILNFHANIQARSSVPVTVKSSGYNIRIGPDSNYRTIGSTTISGNTYLAVAEAPATNTCDGGWFQVINDGGTYFADTNNSSGTGGISRVPDAWICKSVGSIKILEESNPNPTSYSLSVGKAGSGTGTVISGPTTVAQSINCGSTCSGNFPSNVTLSLVPTPLAGSVFAGWAAGSCDNQPTLAQPSCTVAMNRNRTVTAIFNLNNTTPVPVCTVSPKSPSMTTNEFGTRVFSAICTNGAYIYEWRVNGILTYTGGATFEAGTMTGLGSGQHRISVVGKNDTGSSAEDNATLTILSGQSVPSCTILPGSLNVPTTAPPQTFTANCTGNPTSYEWRLNGTVVSSFSPMVLTPGHYGAGQHRITLVASNSAGPSVEASVFLTVTLPQPLVPNCTVSPPSPSVSINATAQTFTANCTNSPSSYQWRVNGTLQNSNGPTLSITPILMGVGAYSISVVASNAAGLSPSAAATLTVTSAPLPDLVVTLIEAATSGRAGENIFARATIRNQGTTAVTSGYRIQFYISTDQSITSSDIDSTWGCNRSTLQPNEETVCGNAIGIPASVATGNYYIGAIVDSYEQITETIESNNALAANTSTFITGTTPLAAPSCSITPANVNVNVSSNTTSLITYSASCTNSPTSYQWRVNGNVISTNNPLGGGPSTLKLDPAVFGIGQHSVTLVATNSSGSSLPAGASLTVSGSNSGASQGKLINISTRAYVGIGDDVLIAGFIIIGGPKRVVIKAEGASLARFGIFNGLSDPVLDLYSGPTRIARNDDWNSTENVALLQSLGQSPTDTKESAILMTLQPGAYTAIVSGSLGSTGIAVISVTDTDDPSAPGRLTNISSRARAATDGLEQAIAGFIISGGNSRVLMKGQGPSLAALGVSGAMPDPAITLNQNGADVAASDNWSAEFLVSTIRNSGKSPSNSQEAALIQTLQPGAYTVIMRGIGRQGIGLVSLDELPALDTPQNVEMHSRYQVAEIAFTEYSRSFPVEFGNPVSNVFTSQGSLVQYFSNSHSLRMNWNGAPSIFYQGPLSQGELVDLGSQLQQSNNLLRFFESLKNSN